MIEPRESREPNQEIEELLPWHLTGRLAPADSDRVSKALADDGYLQSSKAAAAEDLAAVVEANAALPSPSRQALDRLMARVDREPRLGASRLGAVAGFVRLLDWCRSRLSAQSLAFVGAAAVVLLVVQAAAIADLLMTRQGAQTYQTASQAVEAPGATLLVEFSQSAKMADIAGFLDSNGMAIIDGPRQGRFWRVRIGPANLAPTAIEQAIAKLRGQASLVSIVLPGPKP